MKKCFFISILLLLLSGKLHAQTNNDTLAALPDQYLSLYIDGNLNYDDYIRQQITFVNFMRDRQMASLH